MVVVVAGCGGGESGDSVTPASEEARAAILALASPPPELVWAELKATANCMAEAGFRFVPYEYFTPTMASTSSLIGVTSPLSVAEAEKRGYGTKIGSPASAGVADEAYEHYVATLTAAEQRRYQAAKDGPASAEEATVRTSDGAVVSAAVEGCRGRARAAVFGSVENFLRLEYEPQYLLSLSDRVLDNRDVKRAVEEYESLMRAAGYPVGNPAEARQIAQEMFGSRALSDPPSAAERAMAVSDAEAQQQSGVYRAIEQAVMTEGGQWLNANEQLLVELAEVQRASLRRANDIIRA
jgi:hypothetical protein